MHKTQPAKETKYSATEAAIAQLIKSLGLVMERLLTLGSILNLAMRRCVFGKDTYFTLGPSSLPLVVAQLDKRLANRIHTKYPALMWSDHRLFISTLQTDSFVFVS